MADDAHDAENTDDESLWSRYNAAQKHRPIRPLLVELLEQAGAGDGRTAVDLGCGLGRETDAMLRAGWRVHAIDRMDETPANLAATTRAEDQDRLTVQVSTFGGLTELPGTDLVYAGFSIPYMTRPEFAHLWDLVRGALRTGGWCAVNIIGDHDSYTAEHADEWSFFSREETLALFDGWELVKFEEEEYDGQAFSGPKHWHLFHVIARRP